jgi:hypothetical protein
MKPTTGFDSRQGGYFCLSHHVQTCSWGPHSLPPCGPLSFLTVKAPGAGGWPPISVQCPYLFVAYCFNTWPLNDVVGVMTRPLAGRPRNRGSFPGRNLIFSLLRNVCTGSEPYLVSFSVSTCRPFLGGKTDGPWSSPAFSAAVKIAWSCTPTLFYAFMTCTDNFTFAPK